MVVNTEVFNIKQFEIILNAKVKDNWNDLEHLFKAIDMVVKSKWNDFEHWSKKQLKWFRTQK